MALYDVSGYFVNHPKTTLGTSANIVYATDGKIVFSNYDAYTKNPYCSVTFSDMQGFDIYNGVIFQMRAKGSTVNDTMLTINANNSSIIANNIAIDSEHGDSVSFSDEKYDVTDAYPLLYITADTNPAKVYLNRVTVDSAQLVKTLIFALDKTGYYAAHAYDKDNKIMYMVGYSKQNYLSDDNGKNKTIISKWDMSNLTNNGDGTYSPAFISQFERPFIKCMQGQQFKNGMLWIASWYADSSESYVYALDPMNGETLYTIDLETTNEVEGLSFLSDYEMVVGIANGTYVKYTFFNSSTD